MKRSLVVANWKMNLTVHEASVLMHKMNQLIPVHRSVEVVLAPNALALQPLSVEIDHRKFRLAAQNAYYKDEGAFTGEVSYTMLRGLVKYAIVGHSERRIYFYEGLEVVRDKVKAAIRNGITPILCVGETHQERADGETRRVIHDQVTTAISNLTPEEIDDVVIAYEPVWAISTFGGEVAKPDAIAEVFKLIRNEISELYGAAAAQEVRLLYGGSVNDQTAASYLALEDCDGVLVGGASLNAHEFSGIVDAAFRLQHEEE